MKIINWFKKLFKSKHTFTPKEFDVMFSPAETPKNEWTILSQVGRDIHSGVFVEAICKHGVGHHRGVHGCDGCCSDWPKEVALQTTKEE